MLDLITTGALLGLSAGFAPGPLLTLVIAETIRHGLRAGFKVALAPLITDLPIILLSIFLLSRFSGFQSVLGMLSLAGGLFIIHAGYRCMRTHAVAVTTDIGQARSLTKGVVANFLNPHPYLFWISVGTPIMDKALVRGRLPLALFLGIFYLSLVGAKLVVAGAAARSRFFLAGRPYLWTLRLLGLLLCIFGLSLLYNGVRFFGVI